MELYEILGANRITDSLADLSVPDVYPASPHMEVTFVNAPVGRYVATYNFECDFNAQKDKFLGFRTTGDPLSAGVEFSEAIPNSQTDAQKNRLYGAEFDHTVAGDINVGLEFRDVSGGQGFTILNADISVMLVGGL